MLKIEPLEIKEIGVIEEIRQGIVKISGLPNCVYGQMLDIGNDSKGMVIEFNPAAVLGIIFGDEQNVKIGDNVYSEGKPVCVPVGDAFIGRIINCLCQPIDNKGDITASAVYPVFNPAAGVMERLPITEVLQTGIKTVDLVIPVGRGQRELIVGDRQIGKTSIALDAIINQKGKDVICIYCWIGGSHAAFTKIMQLLQQKGAMPYTLAVCASAGCSTSEQYLSPYTAATLGEYFMRQGKNVLVVFDDLTKHAWGYRQMSLLLERAPGREAYPGDIFFLHSQLMERAGRLKPEFGGGTMTFLPIAETLQGDITGYVPSNLVSMTDGQIYLNAGLFQEGFKPAIDLELSVSRIGSKVQCQAIRHFSKGLRYVYSQYRSLLRLTRLKTKLSIEATQQIQKGRVLYELLIQENNAPVSLAEEIVIFYCFNRGILLDLKNEEIQMFKSKFFYYLLNRYPDFKEEIEKTGELTVEIKGKLDSALNEFFHGIVSG
ncbi:MAG: F0F1 ATP synthase subunit alpha [Candidatus Omnitrophota bacterium]